MSATGWGRGGELIKQHLIDPEVCIRCNTCESTCPVGAITHDAHNYVVDVDLCNWCNDCIEPCPTGSIDHYRRVIRLNAYSVEEQLSWDALPAVVPVLQPTTASAGALATFHAVSEQSRPQQALPPFNAATFGSKRAPWSAERPVTHLYGPKALHKTVRATVVCNQPLPVLPGGHTPGPGHNDTHHIELDFGATPFPLLEGQRIGVLPPGTDAHGQPRHPRQYSVASPRSGEHPGTNTTALVVKRVVPGEAGVTALGVTSNHLCDAKPGDQVDVVGPFGSQFLMPNHPGSSLVMMCAGTGSAPMRAMIEQRRRLLASGEGVAGRMLLFFGARTPQELPYFGQLQALLRDVIETHFAFSRVSGAPKRQVQDAMRDRAADLAMLLRDPNAYFYVCGVKGLEESVVLALRDIAIKAGLGWNKLAESLKEDGRLHLETY